jgi:hypothetical protein
VIFYGKMDATCLVHTKRPFSRLSIYPLSQ